VQVPLKIGLLTILVLMEPIPALLFADPEAQPEAIVRAIENQTGQPELDTLSSDATATLYATFVQVKTHSVRPLLKQGRPQDRFIDGDEWAKSQGVPVVLFGCLIFDGKQNLVFELSFLDKAISTTVVKQVSKPVDRNDWQGTFNALAVSVLAQLSERDEYEVAMALVSAEIEASKELSEAVRRSNARIADEAKLDEKNQVAKNKAEANKQNQAQTSGQKAGQEGNQEKETASQVATKQLPENNLLGAKIAALDTKITKAERDQKPRRIIGWITLGVGVAGVATGLYGLIDGLHNYGRYTSTTNYDAANSSKDMLKTDSLLTITGAVAGAAGLIISPLLLFPDETKSLRKERTELATQQEK